MQISKFDVFFEPLANHLIHVTSKHWHADVRAYTADALALLLRQKPANILSRASVLIQRVQTAIDVLERHGALLSLAAILESTCEASGISIFSLSLLIHFLT